MTVAPLVAVRDLHVVSVPDANPIVRGVSFEMAGGAVFTLAGESGSGKSLVAGAVAGTLPVSVTASGRVEIGGVSMLDRIPARRHWRRQVLLLPQEPLSVLDPTLAVGEQVADIIRYVAGRARRDALAQARDVLAAIGIDADAARRRPHALSGGMRQRALFAMALVSPAGLIIADEPTKGLDAPLRDQMCRLMRGLADRGKAIFCVTHDFAIPRQLGGDLAVMHRGRIVEKGRADLVLSAPSHAYTRGLLAALPENGLMVPHAEAS